MEEFDKIAEEQGWDHRTERVILRNFIEDLQVTTELHYYAQNVQRFENAEMLDRL